MRNPAALVDRPRTGPLLQWAPGSAPQRPLLKSAVSVEGTGGRCYQHLRVCRYRRFTLSIPAFSHTHLTRSSLAFVSMGNPRVFFDMTIGGAPAGRIVMDLRADIVYVMAESSRFLF